MAEDYSVRYVGDAIRYRTRDGIDVTPEDPVVSGLSESRAMSLIEDGPFEKATAGPATAGANSVENTNTERVSRDDENTAFNPETESETAVVETENEDVTDDPVEAEDPVETIAESESKAVDSDARETEKDPELHSREELEEKDYNELRSLAVDSDTEEVDGRSSKEEIIDVLSTDA